MAHDDDYLYIAVAVHDDETQLKPGGYPWEQDSLEIRILADDEPARSQSRGEGEFERILIFAIVPDQTHAGLFGADMLPEDIRAVSRATDSGYSAELAIPVKWLNERQGKPWEGVRVNVTMNDYDADGAAQLWWRPDWRRDNTYAGSGTFVRE